MTGHVRGDARKRPKDAATHRANLDVPWRERYEEKATEVEELRAAFDAMYRQRQAMLERAEKAEDRLAALWEAVAKLADEWERCAEAATKRGYPSPADGLTFAQERHATELRALLTEGAE